MDWFLLLWLRFARFLHVALNSLRKLCFEIYCFTILQLHGFKYKHMIVGKISIFSINWLRKIAKQWVKHQEGIEGYMNVEYKLKQQIKMI